MRRFCFYLAVIILLFAQAACRPDELSSVTTSPTVTATTAPSATPMHTQIPLPPTATRTPTNTPPPTLPPTATPWPTETQYPTAPPTNTSSPEPTLPVYEDVEIYAYIMSETQFQSGAYDERLPGYPLNATYSTTDESLAAELKTLIEGDIFVLLTGDYYPAADGNGHLVVENFEYVQQLYTSETPFDAVFQSPQFNFSFRYPADWSVETQPGDGSAPSVRIFNAPFDTNLLRPGREAYDPTAFDVSLHFEPIMVDAYISDQQEAAKADESDDWPTTVTVAYLEMGGQMVAQVTHVSWYRSVNYAVPWAGGIVIITPSMGSGSLENVDFIRRLVESMT